MLRWEDVKKLVDDRWPLLRSSLGSLTLSMSLDGRAQRVVLELVDRRARPALSIQAEICPVGAVQAADRAAPQHGELAISGASYVVRQLLPLDTLTREELERTVRATAIEASGWARRVSRPMAAVGRVAE